MNLTIAIPISLETAIIAERLLDWIYQLNQREKSGHALLVYSDVHEENQMRIRIAAELAFESFDEIVVPSVDKPDKMEAAVAKRNRTFLTAAEYCQKSYRVPWLYLDPTAVPLKQDWLSRIEDAFSNQPRRYMGTHLRASAESKEIFLLPTSVYHMGAFNDCQRVVTEAMSVPFEISCGSMLAPKSTKSRLVQPLKFQDETDFDKIWDEAVIVVGDMSGALIEKLREDGVHLATFSSPLPAFEIESIPTNGKIDLRTKEGRALKEKLKSEGKA